MIDDTGYKYFFWNHPDRYESGTCYVVKTKRTRKLQATQAFATNSTTTKM